MTDFLKDLEYYSSIHNSYVYGEIIDIREENSYIMKNKIDGNEEICESKYIRKITNVSSDSLDEGVWEYIKSEDEFIEVKIKEQKGLFYILELTDEDGNSSTMLARKKNLRCINYIPLDDYIKDKYANVILDIPPELSSWINSQKFEEIMQELEDTNKDSENPEIFVVSYPDEEPSSLRILCDSDKADVVKLMLSTAMDGEKKLSSVNKDKENSKKELEDVKKKNKTFSISKKFVGLIIGKDGVNIKNLKNKYDVNITIDSKTVNEKKFAKVIITGGNGDNVEACFKEINVARKIFEISETCATDIKKRVNNLMETYKIKMIYISHEEKKDDDDKVYKAPNIECIGNEEYINDFYENEIKNYDSYDNYDYGNGYKNYSSGSSYRQSNKRYNNYHGYQNYSKPYKNYNSYNYYNK